jgi:hypothetical protein
MSGSSKKICMTKVSSSEQYLFGVREESLKKNLSGLPHCID